MNILPLEKRVAILTALAEGSSMRSTSRMVGVSINTVTKLLVDAGKGCARYMHDAMRNLTCERMQVDEIWSFCGMKEKNVPAERKGTPGYGDVWTFTAIDADTKLIPCWCVGSRDAGCASHFLCDLASRLTHRIQLTTDGHRMYLEASETAFGGDVDYAQLVKLYGNPPASERRDPSTRYSPGVCCGTERHVIRGRPDREHISTSYVERANLTMRMRMRRFTRLTNAFSKKLENLEHSVALFMMHYNFIKPHMTLTERAEGRKTTPAMAAGVTDHVWSMEDLVAMMERLESQTSN